MSFRINFVTSPQDQKTRRQTIFLAAIFTVIVGLVAATGAGLSYRAVNRGTTVLTELGDLPVITDIRQLVFGPSQGQTGAVASDGRMNLLVLGVGGDGHDGPQLTDTILYASVDLQNKKIGLVSIPRDMAYPLGGGRFEKINAVNAYAEQDFPGEGAKKTAEAFSKLLDTRIDHVVRLDFRGFSDFIDAIGGVDINVERGFVDTQYPTADDKYTTIFFKKGQQHMDGADALVFVRSRHGNNNEGSDFARSHRQQLVMLAAREKLLTLNTLADPQKVAAVYSAVTNHIQTDLSPWDLIKLGGIAKDFSKGNVTMRVMTDAPDGELTAANVNGAFMLFPKKPDWSEIRDIVKNPFETQTQAIAETKPVDNVKLELKNGTTRTGFASQIAAKLEKNGYEITAFGNAIRRGYDQSVIFDLTGGKKPIDLARLRKTLNASVSMTVPSWITKDNSTPTSSRVVYADGLQPERITSPSTDFLVILGESSYALVGTTSYASQTTP